MYVWHNIEAHYATIIAVEKELVLHIVRICSVRYLACNACVPYYIAICGLSGSTIFLRIIS